MKKTNGIHEEKLFRLRETQNAAKQYKSGSCNSCLTYRIEIKAISAFVHLLYDNRDKDGKILLFFFSI